MFAMQDEHTYLTISMLPPLKYFGTKHALPEGFTSQLKNDKK
jgi:hypothetical protein